MADDESDPYAPNTAEDHARILAASCEKLRDRIEAAIDLIDSYGGIDGAHHKQWVLDQVVRALHADAAAYRAWVAAHSEGVYEWDVGIAP